MFAVLLIVPSSLAAADCPRIERIELVPEGLAVRATAPVEATLSSTAPGEVDVQIAASGFDLPRQMQWDEGPFATATWDSARKDRCTALLRIQTRGGTSSWSIIELHRGIVITNRELLDSSREERRRRASALLGRAPQREAGVAGERCASPVTLEAIVPTDTGLRIESSGGAIAPVITRMSAVTESGFENFYQLTIDIPGAQLGSVPVQAEWEKGLFSAMRAVRYRSGDVCGVRLRLVAREADLWEFRPEGNAIVLSGSGALRKARQAAVGEASSRPGGAAIVSVNSSGTTAGRGGSSDTSLQAGLAQRLPDGSTAIATVGINPANTFAAAALEGLTWKGIDADVAAGDLLTAFGQAPAGPSTTSLIQMTFRGAGATLRLPRRTYLEMFAGRASPAIPIRFDGGVVLEPQRTRVRVAGGQIGWTRAAQDFGVSAGWVRSTYTGVEQDNFEQSLYAGRRNRGVQATFEESVVREAAGRHAGYAGTIEPHINSERLTIGGYVRAASRDFAAPAASSFFASLRRSHSLFVSYRPYARLTIGGALAQTKTFSFFDRRDVGTLLDFRSVNAAYQWTDRTAVFGEYGSSSSTSDFGAVVATKSRSHHAGAGATFSSGSTTTTVRAAHEVIDDLLANDLRRDFLRLEGETVRFAPGGSEWVGNLRYLRQAETSASNLFAGRVAYRTAAVRNWSEEVEVQHALTFSEGAIVRQWTASVALRHLGSDSWLTGAVRAGYERTATAFGGAHQAFFFSVSTFHRAEWGGMPRPDVPYTSGALPVLMRREPNVLTRVIVTAFEDANRNGRMDEGENPLGGMLLRLDGNDRRTSAGGKAFADVLAGTHDIWISPLRHLDLIVPNGGRFEFVTRGEARVEVPLPLVPAGTLRGRVQLTTAGADPRLAESIRIRARSATVSLATTTVEGGEFTFGRVPEGDYVVTVERETLAPDSILTSADSQTVTVSGRAVAVVVFSLRRATTRERLGVPPPPP